MPFVLLMKRWDVDITIFLFHKQVIEKMKIYIDILHKNSQKTIGDI